MSDKDVLEGEIVNDYIYCSKCGAKNASSDEYCRYCGEKLNHAKNDVIHCPNCNSTQVEFVTYPASQGFSAGNACCGYLCLGPIGALCGIKPETPAKTVRKCKNCGHEF